MQEHKSTDEVLEKIPSHAGAGVSFRMIFPGAMIFTGTLIVFYLLRQETSACHRRRRMAVIATATNGLDTTSPLDWVSDTARPICPSWREKQSRRQWSNVKRGVMFRSFNSPPIDRQGFRF